MVISSKLNARRACDFGAVSRSLIAAALACVVVAAVPAQAQQPVARGERGAPGAVVEAVQMPAWVERGGASIPLAPGMALRERDRVRTGDNARIVLRLAEGSTVKLGGKASLLLDNLRMQPGENLFAASMNVLEGAFRFTTNALARFRGRRQVEVSIAAVTAGIRGTDLWGKAAADRDIVCLIEGIIEVRRGADAPFTMDQPLMFYIAPKGKPPLPVAPVAREQLEQWAAETEIQAGRGASRRGGKWKVVLATADTQQDALKLYDEVRAAGYAAVIRPGDSQGKHIYDIRIVQLPSKTEAQALAEALRGRFGAEEPRVAR